MHDVDLKRTWGGAGKCKGVRYFEINKIKKLIDSDELGLGK